MFFTRDHGSARIYAAKAVKRFGGRPIVYIIEPFGDMVTLQAAPGTTVFMADGADVLQAIP